LLLLFYGKYTSKNFGLLLAQRFLRAMLVNQVVDQLFLREYSVANKMPQTTRVLYFAAT